MPGVHKNPTIAFRVDGWQRALIEERVKQSGLLKKDFIARSCIYSNIVVVGKKENIQRIVDSAKEMTEVFEDIVRQLLSGDFSCSDKAYEELHNDILAVAITVVDILNGASYLFDKEPPLAGKDFKDKNVAELHEELVVQRYKRNE